MNNESLNEAQLNDLRTRGLLNEGEFAYRAGDLVVAENPVTGEKRVLGQAASLISESNKRVLRG